jgi:hypothetical protein
LHAKMGGIAATGKASACLELGLPCASGQRSPLPMPVR